MVGMQGSAEPGKLLFDIGAVPGPHDLLSRIGKPLAGDKGLAALDVGFS